MQYNFLIDLAEHFHNLILKFIKPRWILRITEVAEMHSKALEIKSKN